MTSHEPRSPEFREIYRRMQEATRLSARLSELAMDDVFAIRSAFEELIGKEVDPTFSLIPPFFADYGLSITIGHNVFINHGCMFMGHGAITIGDDVMIAPRVNLITTGHPVDPETRKSVTVAPVTVGTNVWIGAAATVLPGVTIGRDAVVAAGAVVTRDVPPRSMVAGVPAKVIKLL
jgi:acetyltransferase-like isoleucine patch superfamily enzyme